MLHNARERRKMNMRTQKNTREFHRKSALMVSLKGFFQRKCTTQNTTQKYSRCASPHVPKILINRNGSQTCTSLPWNLTLKNNKFWTVFYALYFFRFSRRSYILKAVAGVHIPSWTGNQTQNYTICSLIPNWDLICWWCRVVYVQLQEERSKEQTTEEEQENTCTVLQIRSRSR